MPLGEVFAKPKERIYFSSSPLQVCLPGTSKFRPGTNILLSGRLIHTILPTVFISTFISEGLVVRYAHRKYSLRILYLHLFTEIAARRRSDQHRPSGSAGQPRQGRKPNKLATKENHTCPHEVSQGTDCVGLQRI